MNNNTNTNNQEATKQQENVEVVEKSTTWCKVLGGITATAAIGVAGYYAYKKVVKGSEE